jgi:hypothetical protein
MVKGSTRLIAPPAKSDVVLESSITNVARIAATGMHHHLFWKRILLIQQIFVGTNVPAGDYVVVPSTFDQGVERSFDIEVKNIVRQRCDCLHFIDIGFTGWSSCID